jgi:DNA-directed RNA polymerase specialized sigma24 family protein
MTDEATPAFDPQHCAEILFLPLADPERRRRDPTRALDAARDLDLLLKTARESAVIEARRASWTWEEIGDHLGITAQAAHSRYARGVAVMLKPLTAWPEQPTGAP